MSRASRTRIVVRREKQPWTEADLVCYSVIGLLAYALSPPWIALFFRLCGAPGRVFYFLDYFYAPITLARRDLPILDCFYFSYRTLLQPWLAGV
jgi:hypothetical protein